MHFKINLTLIAVLAIVLFFNIPFYKNWLDTNIFNQSISYFTVKDQLSVEQRKAARYGSSYVIYNEFVSMYPKLKLDSPLLLLPPEKFLKERGVNGLNVVEPTVYYYLTGKKAVWYDSPDVEKANCALLPDNNGKVMIQRIPNQEELHKLLDIYKKYKLDL
ncbi:hypothetical protein GCM10023093_29780 [Nemorincola caseinilytica]|uniref:Uncharacterized protein n=1 Tax=Nemorincola caseinilytica TaxID=2054315 RepID=A0ABP8NR86_9BACT